MNLILDNMLVIQYKFLQNDVEKEIYENLHTSLYRNYTTMNLQPEAECVYFMIVQPRETIQDKTVTFGSIEGKYDVLVKECDHNKVVRTLKKMYEPLWWSSSKSFAGLSGKNRVC